MHACLPGRASRSARKEGRAGKTAHNYRASLPPSLPTFFAATASIDRHRLCCDLTRFLRLAVVSLKGGIAGVIRLICVRSRSSASSISHIQRQNLSSVSISAYEWHMQKTNLAHVAVIENRPQSPPTHQPPNSSSYIISFLFRSPHSASADHGASPSLLLLSPIFIPASYVGQTIMVSSLAPPRTTSNQ